MRRVMARIARRAAVMLPMVLLVLVTALVWLTPASASAQTRTLKLYFLHTGERAEIAYKRNGRYLPDGLKKINWFLRDWRRNEPTKMDPVLLDLVWEAYRRSGSRDYIHVISAYRSPASNDMLRARGRGVARNSQHTLGKALDFFLPDVKLSKLREIGLQLGSGGVGYYPTSGSPFVHLDTGSVRHWPRMTRSELAKVFPDGKTMHVPTDGKPLARYEQAVAEYKRREATGNVVPQSGTALAGNLAAPARQELTLLQRLAQRTQEDQEDDEANATAPAPRPVTVTAARPAATTTAGPAPQPEAQPEAAVEVAAAAEPQVEEPQFAPLPASVPVPEMAPRDRGTASATLIAAADEATGNEADAAPGATALAVAGDGSDGTLTAELTAADPAPAREEAAREEAGREGPGGDAAAEAAIALAAIPLPAPRPDMELRGDGAPSQDVMAESVLALAPPANTDRETGLRVAALTPEEIEDLRRRATERQAVATPAPRPAASLGNGEQPPADTPSDIVTASLAPIARPAAAQPPAVQPAEAVQVETERQPLEIEPGASSTGIIPLPEPNPLRPGEAPEAQTLVAALGEDAGNAPAVSPSALTNVPVPVPDPRSEGAAQEAAPAAGAGETVELAATAEGNSEPAAQALAGRPVSIDELSAPENNASTIGQFALEAARTISELAEMRAPAYGRNVLRDAGSSIVLAGFDAPVFAPGPNNFSGRAVNPVNYARLSE